MKIQYVGDKLTKTDNVASTGTIWVGYGDVQDVPDKLWPLFAAHPNVWQRADGVIPPGMPMPHLAPVPVVPSEARYVFTDAAGSSYELDGLEDAELKAFAKVHGLDVDLRKKGDALRTLIVEASAESQGA
jgi:hypothetical protein